MMADNFELNARQPQEGLVQREKVFDLKVFRTMKDRAGSDVEVLVTTQPVRLAQLEKQLEMANKQVADIQAKIDAIKAMDVK
jgi:hypothetical protein